MLSQPDGVFTPSSVSNASRILVNDTCALKAFRMALFSVVIVYPYSVGIFMALRIAFAQWEASVFGLHNAVRNVVPPEVGSTVLRFDNTDSSVTLAGFPIADVTQLA